MAQAALLNLHCKYYDFLGAKKLADQMLKEAANNSIQDESWLDMVNGALRVYSELNCHQEMEQLKTLILALDCEMPPRSPKWALKGRVAFEIRHLGYAEECFEAAKHTALVDVDSHKANFGLAICCYFKNEIKCAESIFTHLIDSCIDTEMKIASFIWLGQIANALKEAPQALIYFDQAKALAKADRNHYLWMQVLISEIETFLFLGDLDRTKEAINMAETLLPTDSNGKSHQKIRLAREKVKKIASPFGFELLESAGRIQLTTPDRIKVDLTTQNILVQLLILLGTNPRKCLTKEEICKALWHVPYHPLEMDNKIYVTIRRLRIALHDLPNSPKFILKRGDGYLLNPEYQFTSFQYNSFAKPTELI